MTLLPERADQNQTIKTPSGEVISIRAYKDIHDQIVHSTQKIKKQSFNNLLIDINSIKNLYLKIIQLSHQENYHNLVNDTKITIVRVGDETQTFISFEEFEMNAISQDNATTQIVIDYGFSIRNSFTGETRRYEINLTFNSKLGIALELSKSNKVPKNFQNNILKMIPTVEFTMKYSDYLTTVAFVKAFEEWVNTCENSDSIWDKLMAGAQGISHYFAIFSKIILIIVLLNWFNSSLLLSLKIENFVTLLSYFLNFSGYVLVMFLLTHLFGKKLETLVDSYRSISYVDFNAIDKRIIKEAKPNRTMKIFGHLLMLGVNIFASIVASCIFVRFIE